MLWGHSQMGLPKLNFVTGILRTVRQLVECRERRQMRPRRVSWSCELCGTQWYSSGPSSPHPFMGFADPVQFHNLRYLQRVAQCIIGSSLCAEAEPTHWPLSSLWGSEGWAWSLSSTAPCRGVYTDSKRIWALKCSWPLFPSDENREVFDFWLSASLYFQHFKRKHVLLL